MYRMRFTALLIFILLLLPVPYCLADGVILVVNADNPVLSVTPREAKNIFLGKKNVWDNGDRILAISQKDPEIIEAFSTTVLNRSAQQFRLYWRKQVFSGKKAPLVQVESSDQLKELLANKPGGIGYILESELDSSVKRLEIRSKDLALLKSIQ